MFLSPPRCLRIKNTISRNFHLSCWKLCNADYVEQPKKFVPFLDMIQLRRTEAQRSILVQVQSAQSYKELHSYCSSIGTVKHMYHYCVGVEPMNFIIVEFTNETDVQNILSTSSHFDDPQIIPVHSNFLWFRASSGKLAKLRHHKSPILTIENGNQTIKDMEIRNLLINADSISDQMRILYDRTKLNDIGIRLRFLTAKQVESCMLGMFPKTSAIPFGSSVNGFGKMGCDLDLVLRLCDDKRDQKARLIFHCKAASGSERTSSQRNMEAIGDLIQLFLPGCAQVRRILQARVPIIKYYQQLTDVECDLSMSNMSGVHMSDFLYIMGEIDYRVRPLIFTIRKWAAEIGLTNSSPGRWITNFSLTLLVLAFLQRPVYSPPILPSLNTLVKLSTSKDKYMTEDGINCTFLRNIDKYKTKTQNSESLESLLREFFEFCSQFDFQTKAICLNESVALTKPEHCAMYIVNPLERGLNVSKNVSLEELERFKVEARNAAWILESTSETNKNSNNWGLLSIFENKQKLTNVQFPLSSKAGRLMEVSTLFQEEEETTTTSVNFRNENVRKQVDNIKKEHQQNIKELQQKLSR